jgi:hypothetical protein
MDNFYYTLRDYLRCVDVGFRGLLVWDEGMLDVLARAREAGDLPSDVKLKLSVFAGYGNAAAIRCVERLGADSVNPVADLSRPMLAAIRRATRIPLDIYAHVYDSFGGINRFWEAASIARVAAPCYFKIEPGESESSLYGGWTDPKYHEMHVREKVRHAQVLAELIASESDGAIHPSGAPDRREAAGRDRPWVPVPPVSADTSARAGDRS